MANLYCLRDKVSEHLSHFMLAENDAMYVRELIAHRIAFPLNFRDTEPFLVIEDFNNFDLPDFAPVSWTSWQAPETKAELLAPLGLSAQETIDISRRKIEEQIEELRSKNQPIPQSLTEELNLYTRR